MRKQSVTVDLLLEVMRVINELRVIAVRWFYRNYVNSVPRLYWSRNHGFVFTIWDGRWFFRDDKTGLIYAPGGGGGRYSIRHSNPHIIQH